MINNQQKRYFDIFGYLNLKQIFSKYEMAIITEEADDLLREDLRGKELSGNGQNSAQFVERMKSLTKAVQDDRIYKSVESILGKGFIWAGSEGHITANAEHLWHPDRPGRRDRSDNENELSYTRLKINIYLDSVTEENGCLRVIPGSHRMPLHGEIEPDVRHQTGSTVTPFGLTGSEMPSVSLESEPGDAILFNQSIWHAIFNGWFGRRYIALKFAAKPVTDMHISSLRYYGSDMFLPHESWLHNESDRIRGIVTELPRLAGKEVPAFVPFRDDQEISQILRKTN